MPNTTSACMTATNMFARTCELRSSAGESGALRVEREEVAGLEVQLGQHAAQVMGQSLGVGRLAVVLLRGQAVDFQAEELTGSRLCRQQLSPPLAAPKNTLRLTVSVDTLLLRFCSR